MMDNDGIALLRAAMERRREAWEKEQEAGELKKQAMEEVEIALTVLGIKSAYNPTLGAVVQVEEGVTSSLNKDMLKGALLKRGVAAQIIADATAAATKTSPRIGYVKYQAAEAIKREIKADLRF